MEYTEDVVALFVPIVSTVMFGIVLVAYFYFRYKSRSALQETIQRAIDKGTELSPELMEQLAGPKSGPHTDLRRALVWLAIGIGFVLFGFIIQEEDAVRALSAIGMFPLLIGVAYLVMWKFSGRAD